MRLPEYIQWVIDRVNAHGEQVFVVGGACRDVLLGLTPHDYDLATSATPTRLKAIFHDHKLVLMGEAFGTVGVVVDSHLVELTTFRIEGGYQDHRHPSDLSYTSNLKEDLARRDFTINAMAFHPVMGWVDEHQG
jgi:tRNA nucleotidyltransferase (CCA-adding enzyme)